MEQEIVKLLNRTFKLAAMLVIVIAIYLFAQMGYQQKNIDQQNANQITVSGEGKVYVKPDIALVSLGVTTDGQDVQAITETSVTAMNKIIKSLKDLGIDEKDIQTTQYTVTPKYNWTEKNGSIPAGYTISQNVQVKIRNFDNIGKVLTIASSNGANVISGLQFTIDNPESSKQEARAKAIAQAKINAQNLAKESGVTLGKLINVYEGYSPSPVMYNSAKAMGAGVPDSVAVATIQPGQQEVDVNINLTYQVK